MAHKLGLKLWSSNLFYIKPATDLYRDGVFDYVELYVVPGTEEECLHQWEQMKFPFFLHASHSYGGINLSLKELEPKNRILIKEVESFRAVLDPVQVIFHPGIHGSIEETIRQIIIFRNEFPDLFGLVIIENKPKIGLKDEICVGASPEEMDKIMKETGLGFCLDFGHALCYAAWARKPWAGVIADFLKLKPKVFHLSDGDVDSLKDAHEHLGTGNYDLGTMIPMIPEDGCVALETNHDSREHLDDFQRDVDYFRRMRNGC